MQLEFEVYGALCAMSTFVINEIYADTRDFGGRGDMSPETAEEYSCGDMQFTRNPSTPAVLAKYRITEDEYAEICEKLEGGLSFGHCCLCS
jgi:hypothetical protein